MNYFNQLKGTFARSGMSGFLVAIIAAIFLAWIYPSIGISKASLSLETITTYGVSLIFFFYGLALSVSKLKTGLADWRMHVVIQCATFLIFPIVIILIKPLFVGASAGMMWLGIFYLAALPSTVSSSVVMVSVAGGNIPAAIFNASVSSLIGIIATPLWMGLFLQSDIASFDSWNVIGKLFLQVVLPVSLGMALNSRWGMWAAKNKTRLKLFDQSVIILIIYVSFCQSFYNHVFDDLSAAELVMLGSGMVALFFLVMGLVSVVCRLFHFKREDRITVLFCGSKKSLVHGTVMSKVLFPQNAAIGLLLLPLMLYHALQLTIASIMAQRMAAKPHR